MKYTYSDDEDIFNSDSTNRRSTRNTGTHTPAETGPVTTSSGRQIRAPTRLNAGTGESAPGSVHGDTSEVENEGSAGRTGRPRRSAAVNHGTNGWDGSHARSKSVEDSDDEVSEADFGDDEDDVDAHVPEESEDEDEFDEDEAMVDDDLDDKPASFIVKLSVTPPKLRTLLDPTEVDEEDPLATRGQRPGGIGEAKTETIEAPAVQVPDARASVTVGSKTVSGANSAKTLALGHDADSIDVQLPSASAETALAFRGSPEKQQVKSLP
jgi:hypothetical protein